MALSLVAAAVLGSPCATQESRPQKEQEHFIVLSYPDDGERAIARLEARDVTLEQLVAHIDKRHYPGVSDFLATPAGRLLFKSPVIARWVRNFADIEALKADAVARDLEPKGAEPFLSQAFKSGFEEWLQAYVQERQQGGGEVKLSQQRINSLMSDYQLKLGVATELQGWLDFLVPDEFSEQELRGYYQTQARVFGGSVTFSHILIQNRDAGTGILLEEKGQAEARAKLEDVRARLKSDGSNFEEVARLFSEDSVTAARGGVLRNVLRFDQRLPGILCRTAWSLRDGEISDPVESPYGFHTIKRISFSQTKFFLYTDDVKPMIRSALRRSRQEDLMFRVRKERRVRLLY